MTEFPQTQGSLLAAVKSPENLAAWEEFVMIYRPVIYRMARRRGLQDADAQDLAQTVLVRIAGSIDRYTPQPGTRFRHWLRRVSKNAILTALSQQSKDAALGGSVAVEILSNKPAPASDLEREFDKESERELFLRAASVVRNDIHPETWQAFEMTVVQGMTCERAAQVLDKSVGTVYASRSRVAKRLKEQIEILQRSEA